MIFRTSLFIVTLLLASLQLSSTPRYRSKELNERGKQKILDYFKDYNKSHLDSAIVILNQAVNTGISEENYYQVCRALYNKAFTNYKRQRLDSSLFQYKEAIRYYHKSDTTDWDMLISAHKNIGHAYEVFGLYQMAVKEGEIALSYAEKHLPEVIPGLLYNIGVSKGHISDSTTIDTFFKALDLYQGDNNYPRVAKVHNELGLLFKRSEQWDKSRYHFGQVIASSEYLKDHNPAQYLGQACHNLGATYLEEGKDLTKAETYYHQALKEFLSGADKPYNMFLVYKHLGETKLKLGQIDSSKYYLGMALPYFDRVDLKPEHYDVFDLLRQTHRDDFDNFVYYSSLYDQYSKQFIKALTEARKDNKQMQLQRMINDYNKQVEQIREQEQFRENLPLYIGLILAFAATLLLAYMYYNMKKRRANTREINSILKRD